MYGFRPIDGGLEIVRQPRVMGVSATVAAAVASYNVVPTRTGLATIHTAKS